jgi:chorismate synthase
MSIEKDRISVLSGLRRGRTLGSPLTLVIENRDYANWRALYETELEALPPVTTPRPMHADYPGVIKYGFCDVRDVIERASARETAIRTAVGAVARQCLALAGVEIFSRVVHLGPLELGRGEADLAYYKRCSAEPFGCDDEGLRRQAEQLLSDCRGKGVSVGGVFEVAAFGLPVGLGSYVQADQRLDGHLAQQLMSIPAVKGVEFGQAFDLSRATPGSPGDSLCFTPERGVYYEGNVNGGIAGGISTGQPLITRCAVKPIPTAMPGRTIDLTTCDEAHPVKERSDTTAVPAAAIVGEAVVAWTLLTEGLKAFGNGFLSAR